METRFYFLKEQSKLGGIKLNWIPSASNMADMFTKALTRVKFWDLLQDCNGMQAQEPCVDNLQLSVLYCSTMNNFGLIN